MGDVWDMCEGETTIQHCKEMISLLDCCVVVVGFEYYT